jgi:hypothetical protein
MTQTQQQPQSNITLDDIQTEKLYTRKISEKCALIEALILSLNKANTESREKDEQIKALETEIENLRGERKHR